MAVSIKLLFFGDFVVQNPHSISLAKSLQDLIENSDFSICNFEAPIKTIHSPILKSGPSLFQSTESPNFLNDIGINMVTLANNHIMDYGINGLQETVFSFNKILSIGAGKHTEVYKVKIVTIKNVKIGFLALTQLEAGALTDDSSIEDVGCAWINHFCINSLIKNAKDEVDYLIILSHAGVEDIDYPLPEWRTRYKELIDYGADAIIASHPHVPQGWELYNEKPIFYSLGNFCFDSNSTDKFWNTGLAVQMNIPMNLSEVISFDVNVVNFKGNELSLVNDSEINNHLVKICNILGNDREYNLAINNDVLLLWNNIYNFYFHYFTSSLTLKFGLFNFIKMVFNRIFKRNNFALLSNIISCESHRYAIIRALKLKSKI